MAERVYCLYRVSSAKQVDHDEFNNADIPMQKKACREFAARMGWKIINEVQENGVSGFKVSAADRDKIQLIKEHAEQGKFDILLVFMFDRIGRRAEETPFVVEWLVSQGIRVWSVNEGEQKFESHTDKLTNYIRYWQANGESDKIGIRVKAAMKQMVEEGRWCGGTPPYGYRLEKSGIFNKRKHELMKLVIDEEEAGIVQQIFNLSANLGYGGLRIVAYLNSQGIKTKNGKTWTDSSIRRMLHNEIYIGILKHGETKSEQNHELQIIDNTTFNAVQEQVKKRQNESNETRTIPLNTRGQSLLSGNVFCGHCGARLTLTTSGKRYVKANGELVNKKRIRYVCYNKTRKSGECTGQTGYTMHILDGEVIEILHRIFDKMHKISKEDIIDHVHKKALEDLKKRN